MSGITQLFRELGLVGAPCYLVNRLSIRAFGKRPFFYYSIVAQPVAAPRLRASADFDARVATRWEEIAEAQAEFPAPETVVRERLAQGSICILLYKKGVPVAWAWTALNAYLEDEVRCRFIPAPTDSTAWDFDVYVLPQHRGTMTFVRLWDALNVFYRERNRQWTFSRISRFNITSINSHQGMGALKIANVLFFVVGRMQILISPMRPYMHISFSDRSVPSVPVSIRTAASGSRRS